MPLFMLLSGFFAKKGINIVSKRELKEYIQKKAFQLLVPFSVFGLFFLLVHRWSNVWNNYILLGGREYWFLWVLFQCFVWVALCAFLYDIASKRLGLPLWGKWLCLMLPLLIIQQSGGTLASILSKENFLYNYPFFILGIALSVYPELMKVAANKRIGVLSLCTYVSLMQLHSFSGIEYLRAVCAIQLLITVFHSFIHFRSLETAGRYSLEIYLMHYYLCYLVPHSTFGTIRKYIQCDQILFGGGKYVIDIQLIVMIAACSIIIVAMCVSLARMMQRYDLIRKYFFGKKL